MSPALERARLLLEQSRYELAEKFLRGALAEEPDSFLAHAWLAVCLLNTDRAGEAEAEAREGVHLGPDQPYAHYVHGVVLLARQRFREAREAAEEAIRLDPEDPDNHWLQGAVLHSARRHAEALEAADRGLALDPENEQCLNLRAMALTLLGRKDEADEAAAQALRGAPESADAHANRGWALLHANDPKAAAGAFQEALRLEPGNEWARAGLVEALKARNPVYRVLLGYFLWMARLDARVGLGLMIGGYLLYRFLLRQIHNHPEAAPFLWPVAGFYMAFWILTWIGAPLSNLLLRFSRYGRHALSRSDRLGSTVFGVVFFSALGALATFFATAETLLLGLFAYLIMMTIAVAATFTVHETPRFRMVLVASVLLGAVGLAAWIGALIDAPWQDTLFMATIWAFFGFQWFAAAAGAARPRA